MPNENLHYDWSDMDELVHSTMSQNQWFSLLSRMIMDYSRMIIEYSSSCTSNEAEGAIYYAYEIASTIWKLEELEACPDNCPKLKKAS